MDFSSLMATDSEADDVIRFRVENVKELTYKGVESEVKRINGFPWKLAVYREAGRLRSRHDPRGRNSGDWLGVQLSCEKWRESAVWECRAKGEVKIVGRGGGGEREKFSIIADVDDYEVGFTMIYWGKLMDKKEEYIVDDGITIEAKILIKGPSGDRFRCFDKLDFFSPSSFSDVVLVVDGVSLHVERQILARDSTYFDSLFFGGFRESKETEIVLNDLSVKEFTVLLKFVYGTHGTRVDETNFEFLLKLADRFDIKKIFDAVEKFLLREGKIVLTTARLLNVADRHNFTVLKERCLDSLYSYERIASLKRSEEYKILSGSAKDEIIDLLIQLKEDEDYDNNEEHGENEESYNEEEEEEPY